VHNSFEIRSRRGRAAALAVVTGAALLSPLLATSATASVVGACGAVIPIAAPRNLAEGGVETTGLVHAFVERNGTRLASALTVDAVNPGTYMTTASLPSPAPKVAAATVVDSYMLHSDPLGKPTALQGNRFSVRVSFDSTILGVMVADSSLNGSDAKVGEPGATYPTFAHRGLELLGNAFNDHFTIATDRHTLQVFFSTSTYVDEVRVVVAHTAAAFSQSYSMTNFVGQVVTFGPRAALGNAPANLASPINAASETCTGQGYWLGASDGGIFSFGDAHFFGSMGGQHLNQPIVGMTATPTDAGYWLVASDGGIFSFGDARFAGSMGAKHLNQPIVGMTPSATGKGYRMVATDGGIFSFGDARFFGSMGAVKLNKPVVGMTSTPSGKGYWMVATDGGIFSFGDAKFFGSTGAQHLNQPIVGMKATPTGLGYWLVASDGGIFPFGDASFLGSGVGRTLAVVKVF
jgi:hypothetical protein